MSKAFVSLEEAVSYIQDSSRVFVQGAAATPNELLRGLVENTKVTDVEFVHLHTEGPALYSQKKYRERFKVSNLFVGSNVRASLDYDRVDYLPCFLSEIPELFRSKEFPLDVALLHVSPPDVFGYCSLGTSVDIALAAAQNAKVLVAQVNESMPRVHGDGFIHISRFHALSAVKVPLPECQMKLPDAVTLAIAKNVASLVEDGATLQAGIGAIPDAVMGQLFHLKNLGLHTELWSDGALSLIEKGVINNSLKKVHAGKSVSTFLMGSRKLYDFIDDNPSVIQLGVDYVNSPLVISRNDKVTAINSALEIDLTGQVCADSLGHSIFSGVGGQMDFLRGARLSRGGKPILALPSRTKTGAARIVNALKTGAGVVSTRSHVRFIVTEYGVADLYGKTLSQRAKELIRIAHPEDRERLSFEWKESHS